MTNIVNNNFSDSAISLLITEVLGERRNDKQGKEKQEFPKGIKRLIAEYAETVLEHARCPLPLSVKINDRAVLKTLVDPKVFSVKRNMDDLDLIFERTLHLPPQKVKNEEFGYNFPLESEVMAYAMSKLREKNGTAVELGAGHGLLSLMLAYSAKRVYYNDIHQSANVHVNAWLARLSPDFQQRAKPLIGDCLQLLNDKTAGRYPDLTGGIDLVLCRNLINFFTNAQQKSLFDTVKRMLKPGGQAIFVTNAVYSVQEDQQAILKQNPDATSFRVTTCKVVDLTDSENPSYLPIFERIVPCKDTEVRSQFIAYGVYSRSLGGKWQKDDQEFGRIDLPLQPVVASALKEESHKFKSIRAGEVVVSIGYGRSYTMKTLTDLFTAHHFKVEGTFAVDNMGDRVLALDLFSAKAARVGIVVTSPQNF